MNIGKNESATFKAINNEGVETEYEVMFTYESTETQKNYIIYTDHTVDEDHKTKVYANVYNPDGTEIKLLPIETDEEWNTIETILDEIQRAVIDSNSNGSRLNPNTLEERINKRLDPKNDCDGK